MTRLARDCKTTSVGRIPLGSLADPHEVVVGRSCPERLAESVRMQLHQGSTASGEQIRAGDVGLLFAPSRPPPVRGEDSRTADESPR